jgi:hypothetical protein
VKKIQKNRRGKIGDRMEMQQQIKSRVTQKMISVRGRSRDNKRRENEGGVRNM